MTIAIPAKGRLSKPSVTLLDHAGLDPEQPGDRALAFPCRAAPIDVLLVQAKDIPEYVQDGIVDCGITGADLVREAGVTVTELLSLGFGTCKLEPAVPVESHITEISQLDGCRVATSYPVITRSLLAEWGIRVELAQIAGSVEVAPRLGLADAIVDLVSSGNTLRTNGLRSLGTLFSSQATLIAGPTPTEQAHALAAILRTVVDARMVRYLLFNVATENLEEVCALVPGSRSPTVVPLAEPGMVAVHAVVPSSEVWGLLPRLERAGASSMLLMPVERMLA
jgi:ATP phosphoribosyltransferase